MHQLDLAVAEPHERHVLIRCHDEADPPVGPFPLEPRQLLVLATPGAHQEPSLVDALPALLSDFMEDIESVWLGIGSLATDVEATQQLADELGVEVVAPDGGVVAMPGAALYAGHTAGGTGWHRFGTAMSFHGARFPLPEWESWLPSTPVEADGVTAVPAPCGLALSGAVDFAFDVPVNQRFPKVVVGAPVPSPSAVAALLGALPDRPIMVVPATPAAASHIWLAELAMRLSREVVFSAGMQIRTRAGALSTIVPDEKGNRLFRPFPLVLQQANGGGDQQVLDIASPPPGWQREGRRSYRLTDSDDVIADVVPSGLVLRSPDGALPEIAEATPFDPEGWTLTLGTAGRTVGLPVLRAAEDLLTVLPPEQRAAVRVRMAGTMNEEAEHALDHFARNRKPAPPAEEASEVDGHLSGNGFFVSRPESPTPRPPLPPVEPTLPPPVPSASRPPVESPEHPTAPAVPAASQFPPSVPVPSAGSGVAAASLPPVASPGRPVAPGVPAASQFPPSVPVPSAASAAPAGLQSSPPVGVSPVPSVGTAAPLSPPSVSGPSASPAVPAGFQVLPPVAPQSWPSTAGSPTASMAPVMPPAASTSSAGPPSSPPSPSLSPSPSSSSPSSASPSASSVVPPVMTTSAAPVSTVAGPAVPSVRPPEERVGVPEAPQEIIAAEPERLPAAAPVPAAGGSAVRPFDVPVRGSTAGEQTRFAAAAGESFGEALATVNAALATWPSMRMDESPGAKADYVAVCLFLGRGDGSARSINGAVRGGQAGILEGQVPCLMSGIRRLPTHRRAVLRQGKVNESLEHRSEPGTVLTEPGFLAASIDLDVTMPGADLDVLIWPSSARRTSELMLGRPIDEAVFVAGARFKALAVRTAEEDDAEDDDDGTPVAPRIAVLYRELAPGETPDTTELDERDLAVLAKLDSVLARRHRGALRLVEDPEVTARLTTSMVVWQSEATAAVAS